MYPIEILNKIYKTVLHIVMLSGDINFMLQILGDKLRAVVLYCAELISALLGCVWEPARVGKQNMNMG